MLSRLVSGVAVLACFAAAQDRQTRAKPTDYPASAELAGIWLAAEEYAHSVITDAGAYEARDHLVIDVAVFAKNAKEPVAINAGEFTLRINGKTPTLTDSPGSVAASIKYDNWSNRPRLMTGAGIGGIGIGTGQQRQPRLPGDTTGQPTGQPPPRVDTNDPNRPVQQPASIEEVVQRAAMPEGSHVAPFSGLLYFPYSGKLTKIKTLELRYEGPYGTASLKLR